MILKVVGCEDRVQDNNLSLWGGPGGQSPRLLGNSCNFSKKSSHFNAIWMTFCSFLEQLEKARLLRWWPGGEFPSR